MLQLFQHEPQASMTEELLRRGGVVRIRVLGQSMLPCIWPGDVVIIDGAARGHITIGDIALFRRQNRFFIHRVRKIVDDGICRQLITQGDSVDHEDPPFHSEEVLGKVIQVRRGGRRWIPTRRRSVLGLEWMLARSRRLRNLALRIREKATSTNSRGMI